MSSAKQQHDPWDSPDLQDAAVEYCAGRMPPPGRVESASGAEWRRRCAARFATDLGLPAARLEEMLRRYKAPIHIRLPDAPGGQLAPEPGELAVEIDQGSRERLRADTESTWQNSGILGSGLAQEPENALAALLEEEDWMLESAEREEMARLLEEGLPLEREQRLALSLMLRGSAASARADLARALLQWLCPHLSEPTYAVRREELVVLSPCRAEVWSASKVLSTPHWGLNSQHLRFLEEETGKVRVFFYANASELPARRAGTQRWQVRSLQARGNAHDDTGLRKNLTLLAAFVQRDSTTGVGWAHTFRETKAMVSVRRAKLTKLLNEGTGGKSHLPGMRHRPDPRKGLVLGPRV